MPGSASLIQPYHFLAILRQNLRFFCQGYVGVCEAKIQAQRVAFIISIRGISMHRRPTYIKHQGVSNRVFPRFFINISTDYGHLVRKLPSLHGRKSTPNPKFLGTAKAYFVCHIGPNFQISLIYAFIGCPQSVPYSFSLAAKNRCALPHILMTLFSLLLSQSIDSDTPL